MLFWSRSHCKTRLSNNAPLQGEIPILFGFGGTINLKLRLDPAGLLFFGSNAGTAYHLTKRSYPACRPLPAISTMFLAPAILIFLVQCPSPQAKSKMCFPSIFPKILNKVYSSMLTGKQVASMPYNLLKYGHIPSGLPFLVVHLLTLYFFARM